MLQMDSHALFILDYSLRAKKSAVVIVLSALSPASFGTAVPNALENIGWLGNWLEEYVVQHRRDEYCRHLPRSSDLREIHRFTYSRPVATVLQGPVQSTDINHSPTCLLCIKHPSLPQH
jgi:hypothetical protein